jgi:pantoate--beta-alanine ligase
VFHPTVDEMYPHGPSATRVSVERLSADLCGRVRPGHFSGVATVVAKLLNLVSPDAAYFGQKDWQQLVVVRTMARDLNFPTQIVGVPTVREGSGLARSSRNAYLSEEERERAAAIFRGLESARTAYQNGERSALALTALVQDNVRAQALEPEYVELVHPDTLTPLADAGDWALIAVAVPVGRARLIDNILLGQAPGSASI